MPDAVHIKISKMKNRPCYQVQSCDQCYDRDDSRMFREHTERAKCSDRRGPGVGGEDGEGG